MERVKALQQKNLLEELFRIRDEQREKKQDAVWLIKNKDLPWEYNRQGKMKWYMHPAIEDVALKTLIVYVQEIPPGSRSGRQKIQGGVIMHIMRGRGYTQVNGVRHPWKAGDVVNLPLQPAGIIFQHFNADPDEPCRFICVEPNLIDALGVDKGTAFEQIEDCPEWNSDQPTRYEEGL